MRVASYLQQRELHVVVLGIITFLGVWIAFVMPIHADADWLLLVAQRMLDGDVYGRDIVELNPPLSAYLHFPPVLIARAFALPFAPVFISYVLLFLLGCWALCSHILRNSTLEIGQQRVILIGIAFALLILPNAEIVMYQITQKFGEREHFILAALFPYILLMGFCVEQRPISSRVQSVCGILLGFAVCLKPHFALVPLLLEVYCAHKTRRWFAIINIRTLIAGAIVVGYGVFLWTFHQAYFSIIALTLDTYAAWGGGSAMKLRQFAPFIPILLLCGVCLDYKRTSSAVHACLPVMLLAVLGMYGAGVLQNKGFPYHFLPFAGMIVLVTVVWIIALDADAQRPCYLANPRKLRGKSLFRPTAFVLFGLPSVAVLSFLLRFEKPDFEGVLLQSYLEEQTIKPRSATVLSLENQYLPNTSGVLYASRFINFWPLGAEVLNIPVTRKAEIRWYFFAALCEDFERWHPEVVFVDPEFLPYILKNSPAFAKIWEHYKYIERLQGDDKTLDVYHLSQ